MANPLAVAVRGKGVMPMLVRAGTIAGRYGVTSRKMETAFSQLTAILQEFNCQATLPVTASALLRNSDLALKYQEIGIEFAVHGMTHVDYSRLSMQEQSDHLQSALRIFNQVGIPACGFRSPYLRWNKDTLRALNEYGFDYDASQALAWKIPGMIETEAYRRALLFYGAQIASEYPALPRLSGNVVRFPYCLPDDEAMVERLCLPSGQAKADLWLAMLDQIYSSGELFVLGLHPERIPQCAGALRAVLGKARSLSPSVWIARLDEISTWYRSLGEAWVEKQILTNNCLQVTVHAPENAALLARSVDTDASRCFWGQGYDRILTNSLVIRGQNIPWIGLSADSPSSLKNFLGHLGYLAEIGSDPQMFSYFLERRTFEPEDERQLLDELKLVNQPFLRLARWPAGHQAALAITGDVDAFTLWDYGLRIWNR